MHVTLQTCKSSTLQVSMLKNKQFKTHCNRTIANAQNVLRGVITKGNLLFYSNNSISHTISFTHHFFTVYTRYLADVQILHICLHAFVVFSQQILPSSSVTFCMTAWCKCTTNITVTIHTQRQRIFYGHYSSERELTTCLSSFSTSTDSNKELIN